MKIFNFILAGLFLLFAIVQYNDPDPWKWMALYLIVALTSLMAALNKSNKWIILIGLAIFAFEAYNLYPEFKNWMNDGMPSIIKSMQAESPYIEFVREFLGLIFCFIVMIFHYFQFRRNQIKNLQS
ncbi:MAG: transmembrane 220 family protein [Bacteroidota bacterium]